ncbi:unnamed protein product [Rhodiola kirilowii]
MSKQEENKKGSLDLEQPPHVDGLRTTYTPPPPEAPHQPKSPPQAPATAAAAPQQTVPGYVVAEGVPARERLPCCGLGFGWTLFIIGFFLGVIPWYIGSGLLFYVIHKKDYREKPGCIACLIGAVIMTVLIIVKVATGQPHWL